MTMRNTMVNLHITGRDDTPIPEDGHPMLEAI